MTQYLNRSLPEAGPRVFPTMEEAVAGLEEKWVQAGTRAFVRPRHGQRGSRFERVQRWNCWGVPKRLVLRWRFMRGTDSLLRPFLEARDEATADLQLGKLLIEVADPVIRRLIGAKLRVRLPLDSTAARDANALDAEDLCSEVHGQLARRLHALRDAQRPLAAHPAAVPAPIGNFEAYVATTAFSVWHDYLRCKHPARARLLNQIRYLLDENTRHSGLALWEVPASGERFCGFAAWRGQHQPSNRVAALLQDPAGFVADAVPPSEWRSINPAKLLAVIFDRLGGPVPIAALTDAVAQLWNVQEEATPLAEAVIEQISDSSPSPYDAIRWTEYLAWLWQAVGGLPARQRMAFLLNSQVISEFENAGIASIRTVAVALGLNAEEVASFWHDLPLSDQAIADRLCTSRQQVINLRKGARIILGRQLTAFLADSPPPGHQRENLVMPCSRFFVP